jgi:hypothetical protein
MALVSLIATQDTTSPIYEPLRSRRCAYVHIPWATMRFWAHSLGQHSPAYASHLISALHFQGFMIHEAKNRLVMN